MKTKVSRVLARVAHICFLVTAMAGVLITVTGCTGYRLGSTLPPELKTIYVPTFVNETGEPLVEAETTSAAIAEFQKDGTLSVVSEAQADLVLKVVLTGYRLEPIRFQRDNVKQTSEYRLRLDASLRCVRTSDESVLTSRKLIGEATFFPSGSMSVAKQQALPDAAQDLARDVVSAVVEAW
jgi:hypothetical protein